jgi:hypothetical protein
MRKKTVATHDSSSALEEPDLYRIFLYFSVKGRANLGEINQCHMGRR